MKKSLDKQVTLGHTSKSNIKEKETINAIFVKIPLDKHVNLEDTSTLYMSPLFLQVVTEDLKLINVHIDSDFVLIWGVS